jgi:hypothetical protein
MEAMKVKCIVLREAICMIDLKLTWVTVRAAGTQRKTLNSPLPVQIERGGGEGGGHEGNPLSRTQ